MGKISKKTADSSVEQKKDDTFYAVAAGRSTGIYKKWDDCKIQITGFKNPKYKKFTNEKEATDYLTSQGIQLRPASSSSAVAEISCNSEEGSVDDVTEKAGTGNLTGFITNSEDYIVAYVDGVCRANGKEDSLAGIGVWFGGTSENELNVSQRLNGRQTYNSSKIKAAATAILQIKKKKLTKKIMIKTDCEYVVNVGSKWIVKWKGNGWKAGNGEEIKNKADIEELASAMEDMQVKWVYVTGKQNLEGTKQAKELATKGSKLKE